VFIFSSICKSDELKPNPETDFTFEYAKKELKSSLENYGHHLPGEVYIFIDFPQTRKPGLGKYQSFIWLAKKFGKAEVDFEDAGKGKLIRPTEFEAQWK
jgi:hypothetical protein